MTAFDFAALAANSPRIMVGKRLKQKPTKDKTIEDKPKDKQSATSELLSVLIIMMSIAGLFYPVFSQAKEKALQASCPSNLKRLGLAFSQYEEENDETAPNGADGFGRVSGWSHQIYPYVHSTVPFHCPSDAGDPLGTSSYGMNANAGIQKVMTTKAPQGSAAGRSLADYTAPSKTVQLFEVSGSRYYDVSVRNPASALWDAQPGSGGKSASGYGLGSDYDPAGSNSQAAASARSGDSHLKYATGYMGHSKHTGMFLSPEGRHLGGSDFLMADGHVGWLLPTAVSAGYDDPSNQYCGDDQNGTAANTACPDKTIVATFSVH